MAEPAPAGDDPRPVVAITRSIEDNRSLARRLERAGFSVLAIPLVEVLAPADAGRALRSVLADLVAYDWVVLTSANGVRSVTEARAGEPWPREVSVAAVGPATAAAARSAGMPVRLIPDVATASALVDTFPPASPPASASTGPPVSQPASDGDGEVGERRGRVLAPLAELAGDTVTAGLGAKGWLVDRVDAYRTAADPGVAKRSVAEADVATFFSPSAVDRWTDRFGVRPSTAVCVGPSTATRAREAGFERIVTADPHTEDGVVLALEGLVRSSRNGPR